MKLKQSVLFSLLSLLSLSGYSGVLILNGLTHQNTVKPGEVYRRIIEMQNGSNTVETVMIYQRDYRYNYMGETFYDEPGSNIRSNTGWIDLAQTYLTLQPNEKITIPFQVSVPLNDSLRGSYWSMIMVEGVEPPDPQAEQRTLRIKSVVRYGIQVITHIGSTGLKELAFIGTELHQEDTLTIFNVYVENQGERMLQHEVHLELYDGQGNSTGVFKAPVTRTYPGTSTNCPVNLTGITAGIYSALLIAECDEGDVFGTNITLEISDPANKTTQLPR